jgi:hypothetical protein
MVSVCYHPVIELRCAGTEQGRITDLASTVYTITAAERDEALATVARYRSELAIAQDALDQHLELMSRDENWRNHSDQRRKAALAGDVNALETSIARLERFVTESIIADPEPEPEPSAPARPAVFSAPPRFRVSIAWYRSTCALSGAAIRPGDEITNF